MAGPTQGEGQAPLRRTLPVVAAACLAILVVDQGHLVLSFVRHWANEDHTLMWLVPRLAPRPLGLRVRG